MERENQRLRIKEVFRDEEYISNILRFLRNNGFSCDAYKPAYVQRRILVRLRANRFTSYANYYKLLKRNSEEYRKLLDVLTINVTSFFRDKDVYKIFWDRIVPEFLEATKQKKAIRIWSAGCATGEEPYSITMLMLEALGLDQRRRLFSVYATDIDEGSLEYAKAGIYSDKQLESLPEGLLNKYFVFNGDYRFKRELKCQIKFKRLDLLTDNGIKLCDAIFCRNVLIYFNRADQQKALEKLCGSLRSGGYLVLGQTEILPFGFSDQLVCLDRRARVYRKIV